MPDSSQLDDIPAKGSLVLEPLSDDGSLQSLVVFKFHSPNPVPADVSTLAVLGSDESETGIGDQVEGASEIAVIRLIGPLLGGLEGQCVTDISARVIDAADLNEGADRR